MGFISRGGNFRDEDNIAKNVQITPMRKLPHLQYVCRITYWDLNTSKIL